MSKIYTGCFEKHFEIWSTPIKNFTWTDTQSQEKRHWKTAKTKDVADMAIAALKWATCECEIKEIFVPVEEIPVIEKEENG